MTLSLKHAGKPSFSKRALFVLKAWLKHPADVATICPSSPFLTENIAERDCIREASFILELGPGAGETTAALLHELKPDGRLLAIEKMPAFSEALDAIVDPRFTLEIGDAADLLDTLEKYSLCQPDVIVSGIPFSALPATTAKTIAESIHAALKPGGTFIAYQVRSDIERFARPLFGPSDSEVIAMNLPPLRVFTWRKLV